MFCVCVCVCVCACVQAVKKFNAVESKGKKATADKLEAARDEAQAADKAFREKQSELEQHVTSVNDE
jgi:hypothetical protein